MIGAIVTAAGQSRRMRKQKLLLPFGGRVVIRWVVDALLGGGADEVIVVTSPEGAAIRAALEDLPVQFAENPDPGSDMLSTIRCGLRALPANAETIVMLPGDHPAVSAQVIHAMLSAYHTCGHPILVPVHAGRRGHPLVFSARFREEIMNRHESTGLRGLLLQHANDVAEWPTPDAAVVEDLDTPEDYQRARQRFISQRLG
jgi:molybdenum cofactor cytidylyltransferase